MTTRFILSVTIGTLMMMGTAIADETITLYPGNNQTQAQQRADVARCRNEAGSQIDPLLLPTPHSDTAPSDYGIIGPTTPLVIAPIDHGAVADLEDGVSVPTSDDAELPVDSYDGPIIGSSSYSGEAQYFGRRAAYSTFGYAELEPLYAAPQPPSNLRQGGQQSDPNPIALDPYPNYGIDERIVVSGVTRVCTQFI